MATKSVRIVKVPLPVEKRARDIPKAFPRMPILYLELLENKAKIKPELINKEYRPKPVLEFEGSDTEENFRQEEDVAESGVESRGQSPVASSSSEASSDESNANGSPSGSLSESPGSGSVITDSSDNESVRSDFNDSPAPKKSMTNRLKDLLGDSDVEEDYRPSRRDDSARRELNAPSLGDLEKSGKFYRQREMEDVGHTSLNEQEQEDAKRELLFKFELLRKSYKTQNIPEFSIHSDYATMQKTYESTLRTLSLDKSVEDYKRYLIGGFMLMEFVCGSWLGFDMQGFTQQQIVSMNSYEQLLIELGEKSYVPSGSKWPVEVRLLFMIVMNAAFFIISKMIMKKTGSNLMGMINSMNATAPTSSTSEGGVGKRKMKGPSVTVDDIPDL